jgi:DNA-binding transcriptional MerR regulator
MSATIETNRPLLLTIGEVGRQVGRSATAIRRLEARGVVTPFRTIGQDRRLFTQADVETIKEAIREGRQPLDAA